MSTPKYTRDALVYLRAHLDPKSAGFAGSDEIREALQNPALRVYLQSWVLPLIDVAAGADKDRYLRKDAAWHADRIAQLEAQHTAKGSK